MKQFRRHIASVALYTGAGIAFLSAVFFSGCGDPQAEIPAYLRIDSIYLDSTSYDSTRSVSHKITAGWVYIDDNLQGVYQLPFVVPVLEEGTHELMIYGGVNENGLSSLFSRYPYYERVEMDVDFVKGDTLTVAPHIRYNKGLKVPFWEDFEDDSSPKIEYYSGDGNFSYSTGPDALEGDYGSFYLQSGDTMLVCMTQTITVPKGKPGYFIELDYKNQTDLLVNVLAAGQEYGLVGLNARPYWNKVYINITNLVDVVPTTDIQLVFRVFANPDLPEQNVYIDNLKLVY